MLLTIFFAPKQKSSTGTLKATSSMSTVSYSTVLRPSWTRRLKSRRKRRRTRRVSCPRPSSCRPRPQSSTSMWSASNSTVSLSICSSTLRQKWMWRATLAPRQMSFFKVAIRVPWSMDFTRSMLSSMCDALVARASKLRFQETQARVFSTWSARCVMPRERAKISRRDSTQSEGVKDVLLDKSEWRCSTIIIIKIDSTSRVYIGLQKKRTNLLQK